MSLARQQLSTLIKSQWVSKYVQLSAQLANDLTKLQEIVVEPLDIDSSFLTCVCEHLKKLLDPSWIFIYACLAGLVLFIFVIAR